MAVALDEEAAVTAAVALDERTQPHGWSSRAGIGGTTREGGKEEGESQKK